MPDLEQQLADLAGAIDWPPTPHLAVRVRPLTLPTRWGGLGWGRALAVAAALVLIVASLLAYTPTRDAIASWLNLHTTIHRTQQLATPSPLPSGPLGKRLGLGSPTTLAGAQTKVSWPIWVPSSLGQPDEVYVQVPPSAPSGGEVTLVYATKPGIKASGQTGVAVLITEARGKVNEQFFGKTLGPDTTIEDVSINGHRGWWIAGQPHMFVITDANGNPYFSTLRLATNTLVLDDNGTVVRIEGNMTKDQALKIAGS
ncbi:MAG TPA: hypothetical protein VGE99_11045 [Candidatus Dormibacteraeota bacterium]